MNLTPELQDLREEIEGYARGYGLSFFTTFFEVLPYNQMSMVASYGGFPTRYPHWRFGMEYERLSKSHSYGLSKIYEMVINNDPCYAYLLEGNMLVDQKIVMAHVFAHCDFFKSNYWFSATNRRMIDDMANHASRIRRYIDLYSLEEVESFIDTCLSVDNLIDLHSPFIRRLLREEPPVKEEDVRTQEVPQIHTVREYMRGYLNPQEFLDAQRAKMAEAARREERFPPEPRLDVLQFLMAHAPLKPWQQDVLDIVREEAYYFAPQGQTKIMNEGWASYWHTTIMTQKALHPSELIDYADHHSGTVATQPGHLNPYKLGLELFRDIEERWDKGRFGLEYDACDDMEAKNSWDRQLGLGQEKIFQIRKLYNDVTFIDEFVTPEFCARQKLFTFAYNPRADQYVIASREFEKIKEKLLQQLTNFGQPFVYVHNGNHDNRGELLLKHRHEGVDLRRDWAQETLRNLFKVWGRPVAVDTRLKDKPRRLRWDGDGYHEKDVSQDELDFL
ncbi:MAG: SpoVR family protein [Deltaproteobacteria bacterium]|nr:SpoVR family protein [Deltaproteobacteria bacterium]